MYTQIQAHKHTHVHTGQTRGEDRQGLQKGVMGELKSFFPTFGAGPSCVAWNATNPTLPWALGGWWCRDVIIIKIHIQFVSQGRLPKKPCFLKRYVSLGRISPFCPA